MCFLLPFLFTWCAGWGAGASSCEPAGPSEGAGIVPTPHRLHGTVGTAADTRCSHPPKLGGARPGRGAEELPWGGRPARPARPRPGPSRRPAPRPDPVPAAARSGPSAALLREAPAAPRPPSRPRPDRLLPRREQPAGNDGPPGAPRLRQM